MTIKIENINRDIRCSRENDCTRSDAVFLHYENVYKTIQTVLTDRQKNDNLTEKRSKNLKELLIKNTKVNDAYNEYADAVDNLICEKAPYNCMGKFYLTNIIDDFLSNKADNDRKKRNNNRTARRRKKNK